MSQYGGRRYDTDDRAGQDYGTIPPKSYGAGYDVEGERPPSSDKSLLRRGDADLDNGTEAHQVNLWELVFVPWFLLVLVLTCYLVAGANGQHFVLWLIPIVLITLSLVYIRYNYRLGNSDEVVLGFLALAAVVISTAVGVYGNVAMLQELHRINQGASYFNMWPSEAVGGKLDATSLVFTNTTSVDKSRSFGYTDASSSDVPVYCVAPVTNGEASFKRVQYWAAGINCCGIDKPFTCGQADDTRAHGALLLPPPLQTGRNREFFEKAIVGAQAKYSLTAGNGYLLLDWMSDPIEYRDSLWKHSYMLFGIFAGVYLVISGMVSFVILPIIRGDGS